MFKNYLKIAARNILKNKLSSLLNIVGLALGLACSLLILFHVKEELSYDKQYPESDRIFRLTSESRSGDNLRHWALVSPQHGPEIKSYFPEIEEIARFSQSQAMVLNYTPAGEKSRRFTESNGYAADSTVIEMFDLQFIKGNPETALDEIGTIVLTAGTAEKLFGEEDPLGKTLTVDNDTTLVRVTGVIDDMPFNTHLQFDHLISMPSFYYYMTKEGLGDMLNSRSWAGMYTYVLLNGNTTHAQIKSRFNDFTLNFYSGFGTREEILSTFTHHLQPVTDIHLRSKLEQEMGPNSDIAYVYIFSAIALLILLIAGVNYVNISTSLAFKRMKEVGVRKLLGADNGQIVRQFLSESFLLTLFAAVLAVELFHISIPFYNQLSGKSLSIEQVFTPVNVIFIVVSIFLVGLFAGFYPAFFISRFRPVDSFKGIKEPKSSPARLRKGLVIFQFAISVFMIFSTITIYRQMEHFRTKDLGFDKDQIIALKLNNKLRGEAVQNSDALKTELMRHSSVVSVSTASNLPGERLSVENLKPDGFGEDEDQPQMRFLRTDKDYIKMLDLQLVEGNDFSERTLSTPAFILNERAVQALNLDEPIGKSATDLFGIRGEIRGVVKDFHFASLHNVIEPLVMEYIPAEGPFQKLKTLTTMYLLIKIQGGNIPETIEFIRTIVEEMAPGSLFSYSFVDDNLNRLYDYEHKMSNIFRAFSLFAIFISCLGLFGLSSYSAELRSKEIGVRKVLGASVLNIIVHLSKDFVKWVAIAACIALPFGWYFMHVWLQNFAYRIGIGYVSFILAIASAVIIAMATVSVKAFKAARANPIEALRYE